MRARQKLYRGYTYWFDAFRGRWEACEYVFGKKLTVEISERDQEGIRRRIDRIVENK